MALPEPIDLAPATVDRAPDVANFFSSRLDRIDPDPGWRWSLSVYPSAQQFPLKSFVGNPALVLFSFSELPLEFAGACVDVVPTLSIQHSYSTVAFSDTTAEELQLHQKTLVVLGDGRLVELALDGRLDRVTRHTQTVAFKRAAESIGTLN